VISGALGGAYSTNGPPVILHVNAQPGWSADRRKATLALVTGMLLLGRAAVQTFLPCFGEAEPTSGILNCFCR
jgi:hypothetical protein